ncbi:hypothetical protein [Polaromonas sp.]|uniref:hypothetical protein n=1 Tax=Polaromonas sp. TaxID=1869339 RepID=UPI003BAB4E0C
MKTVLPPSPRATLMAALLALPLATVCVAQTVPSALAVTPEAAAAPVVRPARPDQTIERIRTEDAGTRIDEVRVGGETQSITVQPKTGNNLPAYEVKPSDSTRGSAPSSSSNDTNGARVWNVLKF